MFRVISFVSLLLIGFVLAVTLPTKGFFSVCALVALVCTGFMVRNSIREPMGLGHRIAGLAAAGAVVFLYAWLAIKPPPTLTADLGRQMAAISMVLIASVLARPTRRPHCQPDR